MTGSRASVSLEFTVPRKGGPKAEGAAPPMIMLVRPETSPPGPPETLSARQGRMRSVRLHLTTAISALFRYAGKYAFLRSEGFSRRDAWNKARWLVR